MAQKFISFGARTSDIKQVFNLCKKKNPKVVELGCGNGRDAGEILKLTNDYLGIDISRSMIEIAKKTVPQAKLKVADLEGFEFEKRIDIIFAFAALLHSKKENLKKMFLKATKALNPNGLFFINLKYGNYAEFSKDDEFGTRTYYYYTPEDIEKMAGKSYKTVFKNVHILRDQKWFEIILQKI